MDNFPQKAKKGLQWSVDFLRSKTHETVELRKYNANLKELQKRHEECIRDLGYRTYAMLTKGKLDERALRDRHLTILDLERAIERNLREQIDIRERSKKPDVKLFVPKHTPTCPKCGSVVMALTKYCSECGAPLAEAEQ